MKRFKLIGALIALIALAEIVPCSYVHAQEIPGGPKVTKTQIHSTSKTTVTPVSQDCVLYAVVVNTSNAGTSWTLTIQDKGGTPAILVSALTLATSQNPLVVVNIPQGIKMTAGIDVITGGTTAGVADFWLTYR